MNKIFKGIRNWVKEIATGVLLIIEAVIIFAGFIDFNELTTLSIAIVVADVVTILYGMHFLSVNLILSSKKIEKSLTMSTKL